MKIKINEAGMRELYAGIAKKIEDADRRFRRQHEGYPVAEVKPRVKSAFTAIGVNLPEQQIADYAKAVSAREPFKWVIQ
ncbi:hypothetical protein LVJ59_16320 [Microbacterium sp. KKR3/1]|uniref:hypothetical protein n=1 Tax=Microbacterium sp. KKR3/1 TaxID=2904241 RepID=UPI001E4A1FEC|nr:hypothetical protein [Microbacterium sp. KKR3/1]MCE0510615.1 hypothetical protein [Microbacterium sp. KKR3/1]